MLERICVIGDLRMQNELIVNHVKKAIGIDTVNYDRHEDFFLAVSSIDNILILWDYVSNDDSGLWRLLPVAAGNQQCKPPVAVFNMEPDHEALPDLVMLGARGIFYKTEPISLLVKGIQAILKGELWISRRQLEACLFSANSVVGRGNQRDIGLTAREAQVLAGIASGATNEEIAESLFISISTVKTHNYRIFKKIGANNRMQASLWALKYLPSGNIANPWSTGVADAGRLAGAGKAR